MKKAEDTYWTTVISPKSERFSLGISDLWQKKYLVWLFIKRDLTVQFKQTIFGFAWYFISPIFSTIIYIVVFGRIAGIPTDEIPQPVFYLSGICLWEYFSACLSSVSNTFRTNAGLYGKVYFPRLVSPVSVIISKLFRFSLQLTTFIVVYLIFFFKGANVSPNWYILLFPLIVMCLGMLALGLGLTISSLTTKYRDFNILFGTIMSLWMYATPIVYPLSFVQNPTLHKIMLLNPITSLVETFRYGAMGVGSFSWLSFLYSLVFSFLFVLFGVYLFNRHQKYFIDTI